MKDGCRVVSQAKMLVESGIESSDVKVFNPDKFYIWGWERDYFGYGNSDMNESTNHQTSIKYAKEKGITITVETISISGKTQEAAATLIMQKLNEGKYVILWGSNDSANFAHSCYVGRQASISRGTPVLLNSSSASSVNKDLVTEYIGSSYKDSKKFQTMIVYTVPILDENINAFNNSIDTSIAGYYYLNSDFARVQNAPASTGAEVRSLSHGEVLYISAKGTNTYGNIWYRTTDGYIYPKTDKGVVRLTKIADPYYFEPANVSSFNTSLSDRDYVCSIVHLNGNCTYADTTSMGCIIYEKSGSTYTEVARATDAHSLSSNGRMFYNVSQSPTSSNTKFIKSGTSSTTFSFTPNKVYYYRMFVEYEKNNCSIAYSYNYPADSPYYSFTAPAATSVTAVYSDMQVVNVTATSASLAYKCTVSGTSTKNVSRVTIYLYSSNSVLLGTVYDQAASFSGNYNYFIAKPESPDVMTYNFAPSTTYKARVCATILGNTYYSDYVTFTTLACTHSYGSWSVTTAATCTAAGLETRTCSVCGTKDTRAISATGHTPVTDAAVAATCTASGKTAGSHCSKCGAVITAQQTVAALGHNYGSWSVTTAATCTAAGVETRTCSRCSKKETRAISATGHTPVTDAAVAATCTEPGKTAGSHCSVCGVVLTAQTTVPAKGHTPVTDAAVPATCTTSGLTAGSHCSKCGAVITAQETVPAQGHTFGAWTLVKAPTLLEEGRFMRVCSCCGEKEYMPIEKIPITNADVDASGYINIADVSAILDRLSTGTGTDNAVDLDMNGTMDIQDVTALLNLLSKMD